MRTFKFISLLALSGFSLACSPLNAEYLDPPNLNGGLDTGNDMKHVLVYLFGNSFSATLEPGPTPVLRSLPEPYEFDPAQPEAVLQGKAHNFQHGWLVGFINRNLLPPGSELWIEQLSASPGLEVYSTALPSSNDYQPIFGTAGSSTKWQWNGDMIHNAYAVLHPLESQYEATYKIYLGDADGEALASYQPAEITLRFDADPLLPADFNADLAVDAADHSLWQQHFGMMEAATHLDGDSDLDGDVDGADFLMWQRFNSLSQSSLATASIPEPHALASLSAAALMLGICVRRN